MSRFILTAIYFVGAASISGGTSSVSSITHSTLPDTPLSRPGSRQPSDTESECSFDSTYSSTVTTPNEKKLIEDNLCKCNLLINEILTSEGENSDRQYIEVTEKCGRRSRLKSTSKMEGVVVLAVQAAEPGHVDRSWSGKIVLSVELAGTMHSIPGSSKTDDKYYYVIGNSERVGQVFQKTISVASSQPPYAGLIPPESDIPVAVTLLRFTLKERSSINKLLFNIKTQAEGFIPITQDLEGIIKTHLIDMIVYGTRISDTDAEFFRRLHTEFPSFIHSSMFSSQSTNSVGTRDSFSRCSNHNAPFAVSNFKKTTQTPGSRNTCNVGNTLEDLIYPHVFRTGDILQHTAMYLILNCEYAVSKIDAYPQILEGNPRDITAKLMGISRASVYNINKKQQQNALLTPKRRLRKSPIFTSIDNFDRDFITREIQKEYIKGVAPDAKVIYDRFMTFKRTDTSGSQSNPSSFKCSLKTFKRVLLNMGFRYQKIDDRAAILQRYDLTRWRGRFMKALMENEQKPTLSQKNVVYIDETWVDTNGRVAKGWAPKTFKRFKDMAAYSYSTHKIGRGPRLIVLAAVSVEGVIPGSVVVYKVTSALTAEDYHKNVGKDEFTKWFDNLAKILKEKGGQHIVVMDNASYHSAKATPKRADKKEVVYKYIEQQVQLKRVDVALRPMKEMRRWELDAILDNIVKLPQMQRYLYELDQKAEKSGIEVVRLPPYHCHFNPIEYVWRDVKLKIRKQNTEQKIDSIKPIVEKELKEYGADQIANHWKHVKNLRDKTWKEDNYFEIIQDSIVINPNEDDDDEWYSEDNDDSEDENFEDEISYADDVWRMQDGIDLEGEVFSDENELLGFMEQRRQPKKRRGCPRSLAFHHDD